MTFNDIKRPNGGNITLGNTELSSLRTTVFDVEVNNNENFITNENLSSEFELPTSQQEAESKPTSQ